MADVKLRIDVNESSTATNINVQSSATPNNVGFSSAPASYDDSFKGTELLSWATGSLSFNNDSKLANSKTGKSGQLQSESNPRQFVWGTTNSNGEYSVTLTLTAVSGTFDKIVLVGDKISEQFPIQITVGGVSYYSDDPYWVIDLGEQAQSHTIEITKWNRANYNACLNAIKIMNQSVDVDRFNGLISVESSSQLFSSASNIDGQALSNFGSAKAIDKDGELYDLFVDGIIEKDKAKTSLIANDNMVAYHVINKTDYAEDTGFSLELGDAFDSIMKTTCPGVSSSSDPNNPSIAFLFDDVLNLAGLSLFDDTYFGYMLVKPGQEVGIWNMMTIWRLSHYFINKDTFANVFKLLCQAVGCSLISKKDKLTLVSTRPVRLYHDDVIVVPRRNQFSRIVYDFIPSIKYDKVIVERANFSSANDNSNYSFVSQTYGTGDSVYEITGNYLIQQPSSSYPHDLGDIVARNIIADYGYGVKTAKVTLTCSDYYDTDGNLVKNWSDGEIIDVGDIIRIDKDNLGTSLFKNKDESDIYWRVVGRKYRHSGVSYVDLELQECVYPMDTSIEYQYGQIYIGNNVSIIDTEVDVYIRSANPNAKIYYTTDGSDPTTSSTQLQTSPIQDREAIGIVGTFHIRKNSSSDNKTIKAIAVDGNKKSLIRSVIV